MKYIAPIAGLVLSLTIIAAATFYISKRFALFFPIVSFKGWLWIFGGFTVALFLGVGSQLFFSIPNIFEKIIFIVGSFWLAIMLYLLLSIAVTDLINLFFKISPTLRGLASLILANTIIIYGVANATTIKVKEISIPIAGLTKEIKAVHITDIHLGYFWGKKHLEKIVDKTIELNPDVIFNTGDFFDNKSYFREKSYIREPLDKLTIPHYFVNGNHDEYAGIEEVVEMLKAAGVIVLQNEISYFGELQIIGLNDMLKDENSLDMHPKSGTETIKSVMSKLPIEENRPTIVLHHRPNGVEYMEAKNANLLLAGHTHGGQLFPITLMANAMFPYNKGLYKYGNMNIYVSTGLGTIFPLIRIGTNSEIILIRLVPQ